jgi:hypothetical protein
MKRKLLNDTERKEHKREYNVRYFATPEGRAALRRTQAKYFLSKKGMAARKRTRRKANAVIWEQRMAQGAEQGVFL